MEVQEVKEQLKSIFRQVINNDKWITIHPNGEDEKGKHLLLKDGESPKEAIDRVYKKEDKKEDNPKAQYTYDMPNGDKIQKLLDEKHKLEDDFSKSKDKSSIIERKEEIDKEIEKLKSHTKDKQPDTKDGSKDISKEEHAKIKEQVSKMSDDELVKAHFESQKGYESETPRAGSMTKHEATYGEVAQELKRRTGRSFSPASTESEIKEALSKAKSDSKGDSKQKKPVGISDISNILADESKFKQFADDLFFEDINANISGDLMKELYKIRKSNDYSSKAEWDEKLKRKLKQIIKSDSKGDLDIKKTTVKMKSGKTKEIEYVDSVPEGYKKLEGAMTAPLGYTWYHNGKSIIDKERKTILVKDKTTLDDKIKETKENKNTETKKYNYTLTKREVEYNKMLGGMADTGNYYTNGEFAIDKKYLNIKGQEPTKKEEIEKSLKHILKGDSTYRYTPVKDFEIGELKREYGKPIKVAKYSYYDEKNGYERNIYLNKKYNDLFKNFDLKFGGEAEPVFAYKGKDIVGVVMPINAREQSYSKTVNNEIEEELTEDKNQLKLKIDNSKEQDMAIIEELKKLIFKVENNKENETMVENEKVDKRKLIDEVAGIMKSAGCDDEDIRTAIGKMEKIGYDDSEASADNKKVKNEVDEEEEEKKVDNEDEEDKEKVEDLEEEEKKDVKNKCKNSKEESYFDKLNKIYNSAKKVEEPSKSYESRQSRLEAGEKYFG